MNILRREIEYEADQVRMIGYFSLQEPRERRRPGILVGPPGPGLGEHTRSVARRLAKAGYAAFALDYHGGGAVLTDSAEHDGAPWALSRESARDPRARCKRARRAARAAGSRRHENRRHRLLLRRDGGARARTQRRAGCGHGRLSQWAQDRSAARCGQHQGKGARLSRRR